MRWIALESIIRPSQMLLILLTQGQFDPTISSVESTKEDPMTTAYLNTGGGVI